MAVDISRMYYTFCWQQNTLHCKIKLWVEYLIWASNILKGIPFNEKDDKNGEALHDYKVYTEKTGTII